MTYLEVYIKDKRASLKPTEKATELSDCSLQRFGKGSKYRNESFPCYCFDAQRLHFFGKSISIPLGLSFQKLSSTVFERTRLEHCQLKPNQLDDHRVQ